MLLNSTNFNNLLYFIKNIIFYYIIIDSFLRKRNTHDHEATAMMKAQFMTLWDGLITDTDCSVIIMGATNRPNDLDNAILRRMPATFYIHLPVHNILIRYIFSEIYITLLIVIKFYFFSFCRKKSNVGKF